MFNTKSRFLKIAILYLIFNNKNNRYTRKKEYEVVIGLYMKIFLIYYFY